MRKRAIAVDTLTMLLCIAIHGKYTYKRDSYCIALLYIYIYIYIYIYG